MEERQIPPPWKCWWLFWTSVKQKPESNSIPTFLFLLILHNIPFVPFSLRAKPDVTQIYIITEKQWAMLTEQPIYWVGMIFSVKWWRAWWLTSLKSSVNLSCLFFAFSESRTISRWNKIECRDGWFWKFWPFARWAEKASWYLSQGLDGCLVIRVEMDRVLGSGSKVLIQ